MVKKDIKTICMRIDRRLFDLSKLIISNRTKDYENYLQRKLMVRDKSAFLRDEIEKHESIIGELEVEYNIEIELQKEEEEKIRKDGTILDSCIGTVMKIIDNEGIIGLDRLEEIANFKGISVSELKKAMPEEYKSKFVNFHPQYKDKNKLSGMG
ncbi:hypothetical protein [Methanobacterium formicicum]|uniref:Uncharacterized protein n=1 Tax=Methanobacterium formicicum (strain DSM 3637 / PP1) TaxID=1204725 RepID=K2RER3_METFP|nr:hypothetical protein [Methanobacterium formicicum]EKF86849.1 hypothetical protein A994_01145 [Methanobacterium formicicum DSM 3637]